MAHPIAAIFVGAVVAIIALIKVFKKLIPAIVNGFKKVGKTIKDNVYKVVTSKEGKNFVKLFDNLYNLPKNIITNWRDLPAVFKELGDSLKAAFEPFFTAFKEGFTKLKDWFVNILKDLFNAFFSILVDPMTKLFEDFKKPFEGMFDGIKAKGIDFKNNFVGNNGKAEIDINVKAENGTTATIDKVNSQNTKLKMTNDSNLGKTIK